jgi:hypothetical protein
MRNANKDEMVNADLQRKMVNQPRTAPKAKPVAKSTFKPRVSDEANDTLRPEDMQKMKKGGKTKCMAKGGLTSGRGDGIASKGKTKCKYV